MPWSVADFSTVTLSCGEPLPSKGTTSNFGSVAALRALSCATTSRNCLSEPSPACANGPDSTSMKAIFTVSAAVARAGTQASQAASVIQRTRDRVGVMGWILR